MGGDAVATKRQIFDENESVIRTVTVQCGCLFSLLGKWHERFSVSILPLTNHR